VSIKRLRGKPEYEPSIADKETVRNLAAMGKPHAVIAKCIGTRGISEPTLRKHFRRELDVSETEVNDMAMASIIKGLKAGDAWATCFYLKCRAGWKETSAHQFVDEHGKDRPLQLSDLDRIAMDDQEPAK
jgi:hypothetical protein